MRGQSWWLLHFACFALATLIHSSPSSKRRHAKEFHLDSKTIEDKIKEEFPPDFVDSTERDFPFDDDFDDAEESFKDKSEYDKLITTNMKERHLFDKRVSNDRDEIKIRQNKDIIESIKDVEEDIVQTKKYKFREITEKREDIDEILETREDKYRDLSEINRDLLEITENKSQKPENNRQGDTQIIKQSETKQNNYKLAKTTENGLNKQTKTSQDDEEKLKIKDRDFTETRSSVFNPKLASLVDSADITEDQESDPRDDSDSKYESPAPGEGSSLDLVDCSGVAPSCVCGNGGTEMACKYAGLTDVPALSAKLLKLDLTGNNITMLRRVSFQHAIRLEELNMSENRLETISAGSLEPVASLTRLSLAGCGLRWLPSHALRPLTRLLHLQLDNNDLVELEAAAFLTLTNLRTLKLENNHLRAVPTAALRELTHLELLNLGGNLLSVLTESSLPHLPNLRSLSLKRNEIIIVKEDAFSNTTGLRVLHLDDNMLIDIPLAIHKLPRLQELSVSGNLITYIGAGVLQRCSALAQLELRGNPLIRVHPLAFAHLPALKQLVLSDARALRDFPTLNGSTALETLRLDRAAIRALPHDLCRACPKLRTLDVKSNRITRLPDLTACRELRVLDLTSNRIESLETRPFRGLSRLHDLLLAHNQIGAVPRDAFHGLAALQVLDLEDNRIEFIHSDAFLPISKLEDLNLANNYFPHLPPSGLQHLLHLKTFNNPNLKKFHRPDVFPRIQTLVLSYAYHCCPFMPLMEQLYEMEEPKPQLTESIIFPKDKDFLLWSKNVTDIWPQYSNISKKLGTPVKGLLEAFGTDFTYPANLPAYAEEYFEDEDHVGSSDLPPRKIQCLPLPGPFLPCVDLFDWWTLRCGVWVVFLLALLGNGTVVFVLIFSRSKMDVPRFLVCNLAAADFFMGIYLGFLAVVDASTLGEFRAHAIAWQMSGACRLAGFLGVLSSELSVYTLAVITLERNYAITHAMHLNKRLSLRHAVYVMAGGWGFSLIAATLPLFGISDYRKFAVCLPFETKGVASLTYVALLMSINGAAFLVLLGCYLKMYCAIRGSQAWNSNDSRIAKRMALLVFTDFLCWSPIAFFALTAAFGVQLVSLEQAKVFTVFVLPLNSCCNPFLYAILTKQFKKDCALVCKAIEESRVTRGIGRCRHSSNFSNRQTPANTNSLVERSSRGQHAPHCACRARLLGSTEPPRRETRARLTRWFAACGARRTARATQQTTRTQPGPTPRTGSVSSSENFSSSRSDSWRAYTHHRAPPPPRRAASWLIARKTSQDSNLSSSRNDSSGSATTASTGTWRTSRSSGRPRLTRQLAVTDEPPPSPARLAVRFLHTIPSAAEPEPPPDEESQESCNTHSPTNTPPECNSAPH